MNEMNDAGRVRRSGSGGIDCTAMLQSALQSARAGFRSTPSEALGFRPILILTAVFWGGFALLSIAYAWPEIVERPSLAWRPLAGDAVGAALSLGVALSLRETRRWDLAARLVLAAALCLVAVTIYSALSAALIAPYLAAVEDQAVAAARVLRLMAVHYWVFAVHAGLFLLLDQREAPDSRRSEEASRLQALRRSVLGAPAAYAGLDARWFWTFQAAFWSGMFIFSTANLVNQGDDAINAWRIGLAEGAGLVASSLTHFLALRPSRLWPLYQRAALALAAAIMMTAIYAVAIWAAFFVVLPVPRFSPEGEALDTGARFLMAAFPRWMFLNFPVFVGWSGFYLALDSARRLREQERQLYKSIVLAQEAQLKMLRFQLNPHFLFNTLNAVSTLVLDGRAEEAESMLSRLSRFLRFTLDATPRDQCPLEREIAAQELYLEIEKSRFGDRLVVSIEVDDEVADAMVPTLILQPLTENAVKYAVARSSEPVRIEIRAQREGDARLRLEVTDEGATTASGAIAGGATVSSAGVGLSNIRARLNALYGDDAELVAGPRPEGGFAARIIMPLKVDETGSDTGVDGGAEIGRSATMES
ncbi:hypothetical protein DDZ18_11670 [Marinicauda salina]|uniref:Uncharacterized protein n=1 Tax=Marinicauda salina TaxID=2135793 RepID=A0A2U2BS76_9PROT|nr:histidine kinase [Marinicauda salina]PWE16842.1 hypothetical protein DDZ18_11670 [Marinicauda salina]